MDYDVDWVMIHILANSTVTDRFFENCTIKIRGNCTFDGCDFDNVAIITDGKSRPTFMNGTMKDVTIDGRHPLEGMEAVIF